ncbi:MAG: hypothetical protein HYW45_03390 [Candidatus Daviesbacteria bacterium]|nr:MAG: hypothetical protein HYW45_03390 [Candidatus Daviesbacteria bacterium]
MRIREKGLVLCIVGLLLFVLPLILNSYPISHVYAAENSTSANLKEKLSALQKEIASKAAQLKQEVNKNLQNKAYVGMVTLKSEASLTLATDSGAKIVSINQDSEFSSNNKKISKYSLKILQAEDFIAALGDVDENGVLTAKKVILWPTPSPEVKTHLWGQVISIADELVTLTTKEGKNVTIAVSSTDLEKDGQAVSLSQLSKNNFVIVTGVMGKNEILTADFVYIYSQPAFLKPKKIATPSAESATKSAKPTTPSTKKKSP